MQSFKDYLVSEFAERAKNHVAIDFKFSHSISMKIDKSTNKHLKIDIIKVTLKFFDKNLNLLHSASISFENNVIPKIKAKQLINISPKELEVKFGFAKREICNEIYKELKEKLDDFQLKLTNLNNYIGSEGIIPTEFKGETINISNENESPPKSSQKFEM